MGWVSVVIPAHNEAVLLPATLAALRPLDVVGEIVVVDDGSADGTAEVAQGPKTRVVGLPRRRGKGAALQRGVERTHGPIIALLDADLGPTAALLEPLVEPVQRGRVDVAIAAFGAAKPAGFGLAQGVARAGLRRLVGVEMQRPLSGQRAFRRRVWQAVASFAPGFGAEVAFTIDAVRAGFRVQEISVPMAHRESDRSLAGFMHRGLQLWDVARALAPRLAGDLFKGRRLGTKGG